MKYVLIIVIAFLQIQVAHARHTPGHPTPNPVIELERKSYTSILPALQATLGPAGEERISQLNQAYKKLVAMGIANPTFGQVVNELRATSDVALVGTCLIAVLVVAPFVIGAFRSLSELDNTRQDREALGEEMRCKYGAAKILNNSTIASEPIASSEPATL